SGSKLPSTFIPSSAASGSKLPSTFIPSSSASSSASSPQLKKPAWKPGFSHSTSNHPKSPQKKPNISGFPSTQPKLPTSKPKSVPTQNPLPNNSKENGKIKNWFKGGGTRGGTATAGGSRTVTVITLDDDDNTPRTGLNNVNSNVSGRITNTSVSGGAVRNPEDKKPTGFVPFSGKGYTLGGSGASPDKKRPRNY
ncbi:unnamed protein product, partial [Allacma fusca]